MKKELCKIETWEQFKKELKKQLYPINMVYEAMRKLRELGQTATIRECTRVHYLNDANHVVFRRRFPHLLLGCVEKCGKTGVKKTLSSQRG